MSVQTEVSEVPPFEQLHEPRRPVGLSFRGRGINWFELGLLLVFAVVSSWVLALDLWQVIAHGRIWTGSDGFYGVDQFQYQAWIREASRHFLVSNLFVLHSTPADYFQPAIVISGGLTALGVSPTVSLLLWKPVAILAVFFTSRAYIARNLDGRAACLAALALTLFFGSYTYVYGSVSTIGDLFPPFLAWGYPFGLIGLAAMVAGLLSYDRARANERVGWMPGVLGATASLLHPWNGVLLIAAVLGGEVVMADRRRVTVRQLTQPVATVVLAGIPIAYYVLLGKVDLSWRLAKIASKHGYPLWSIVVELLPLLLPALLAYRRRPQSFLRATVMVWPVAAFALFVVSMTRFAATPVHAFQGITLPLSVLAIDGLRGVGFNRLRYHLVWGTLLVAAFTIPPTISQLKLAKRVVTPQPGGNNFITTSEHRALNFLARDRQPGGVITGIYLGEIIPGVTGRHVYLGDCLWSQPGCKRREGDMKALFHRGYTPPAARAFVLSQKGARFVLEDCRPSHLPIEKPLAPITVAVHRFGCATVYEIR